MNTLAHTWHRQASLAIFSILIIGSIASCTSYRKAIREPLKVHGTEYLIEQMKENEIKSGYFTARFSAELTRNREKISFTGQMRMKKDSIIWMTLSPALGIEMGRLIITNDSVKWMNRMESNFMLTTTDYLAHKTHPLLQFDLIQAFILGNDLTLYDDTQFRGGIDNREYKLSVMQRRSLKKQLKENESIEAIPLQHLWLDPETFRITRVSIKDLQDKDARIDVAYQRFADVNGFLFASRQEYDIQGGGNKLSLSINFSRPDTPESSSFPFTVPEKYISVSY